MDMFAQGPGWRNVQPTRHAMAGKRTNHHRRSERPSRARATSAASIAYIRSSTPSTTSPSGINSWGAPSSNVTERGSTFITRNPLLAPYVVKITKSAQARRRFWPGDAELDDRPRPAEPIAVE